MAVTEICDLCFQSNSSRNTTTHPAGIWCQNDVVLTSMRRDDVASTLIRRHFHTKCPLGQHISAALLCSNVFKSPSSNDVLASFVIIKVMVILLLYVAFRNVWCLNLHYIKELILRLWLNFENICQCSLLPMI